MLKNIMQYIVDGTGQYLFVPVEEITANDNLTTRIQLVCPIPTNDSVTIHFTLFNSVNKDLKQYMIPNQKKAGFFVDAANPLYQTVAEWSVFEVDISQKVLAYISKYRAGRVGVAFKVVERVPSADATNYRGLFGNGKSLPEDPQFGDYVICDTFNYWLEGKLYNKGDILYYTDSWQQGAVNETLHTETEDVSVSPSLDVSDEDIDGSEIALALAEMAELINDKQDKADSGLTTTDKTVVGAINEIKVRADGYVTNNDMEQYTYPKDVIDDKDDAVLHQVVEEYYNKTQADNRFVDNFSDEEVHGTKDFKDNPHVPDPTANPHAVNRKTLLTDYLTTSQTNALVTALHDELMIEIEEAKAIALNTNLALEFETTAILDDWFDGIYIRPDGKVPEDLVIGQRIYIVEPSEDDYWVRIVPTTSRDDLEIWTGDPLVLKASLTEFDDTSTELGATNVQSALENLKTRADANATRVDIETIIIEPSDWVLVDDEYIYTYQNDAYNNTLLQELRFSMVDIEESRMLIDNGIGAVGITEYSAGDKMYTKIHLNQQPTFDITLRVSLLGKQTISNTQPIITAGKVSYNNFQSGLIGSNIQNAVDELAGQNTSIIGNVGELETEISTINDNIGSLSGNVGEIETEISTINDSISSLSGDVTNFVYTRTPVFQPDKTYILYDANIGINRLNVIGNAGLMIDKGDGTALIPHESGDYIEITYTKAGRYWITILGQMVEGCFSSSDNLNMDSPNLDCRYSIMEIKLGLNSGQIEDDVTRVKLNEGCFAFCKNLRFVHILPITQFYLDEIGASAFEGCSNLENIICQTNYINNYSPLYNCNVRYNCFLGCKKLKNLHNELMNQGAKLYYMSFAYCNFSEVNLRGFYHVVSPNVFEGCEFITYVNCWYTENIPEELFKGCISLRTLECNKNISFGTDAFADVVLSELIVTGNATQAEAEAVRDAVIVAGGSFMTNYRLLY